MKSQTYTSFQLLMAIDNWNQLFKIFTEKWLCKNGLFELAPGPNWYIIRAGWVLAWWWAARNSYGASLVWISSHVEILAPVGARPMAIAIALLYFCRKNKYWFYEFKILLKNKFSSLSWNFQESFQKLAMNRTSKNQAIQINT